MLVSAIIPLYKQAQFLIEAVDSVLSQTHNATNVVIVNDGCPDPASDYYGMAYAKLEPRRVSYVKQPNRGLSAARNAGVRHALERWPKSDAFFFLDADNFLAPHAVEMMSAGLADDTDVGWVYPVQERFGEDAMNWCSESPANLFYMLFENQSDAGSLIRRKIFDAGIYFDESMRKGYEDWEFFIRALRQGFKGRTAGKCGFYYRVRRHSMLVESEQQHDGLVDDLHGRHSDLLQPRKLTGVEHEHCPRFLWAVEDGEIAFTDPDAVTPSSVPQGYHPPVLIMSSAATLAALREAKVLRSVLLLCQAVAPWMPIRLGIGRSENSVNISSDVAKAERHVTAFYSGAFEDPNGSGYSAHRARRLLLQSANFQLDLPEAGLPSLAPLDDVVATQMLERLSATGIFAKAQRGEPHSSVQQSSRMFSWERNCCKLDTTYPYIGEGQPHVGFVVPWLKLGGVDLCVIQLAEAVRRIAPNVRLSLVTTQEGVDYGAEALKLFDDLVCLQQFLPEHRIPLCDATFRSMDLVVNAHSMAAYESLSRRLDKKAGKRAGLHIAYLHVIDQHNGEWGGYPYIAAAKEEAIDGFAVISDNLKSFLVNQGIAQFRIKTARNAAVVRPRDIAAARQMASDKAARLARGERPLRLLFAGRADYQKGISRLKLLVDELVRKGVPFELTFVGQAILNAEVVDWPEQYVRTLPATRDPVLLSRYYADHDVYLLLSRWEGVPLALLDAMAHGCVVVATEVGAVNELVVDRRNGFLVANGADADVARQAEHVIEGILGDGSGSHALRHAAVEDAWGHSWDDAARSILSFLPDFRHWR